MKDCQCYARCIDPVRQAMWDRIFSPDGNVPITAPVPAGRGELAGEKADFYLVDLDRVSEKAKARLIDEMAAKFGLSREEVAADIAAQGVPIKAAGICISICRRHCLALI